MNRPPARNSPSAPLVSPIIEAKYTWGLTILTVSWLTITIVFIWSTTSGGGMRADSFALNPSLKIFILQGLTQVNAWILSGLFAMTLDTVLWAAVSRANGLTMPQFLAISSSTGIHGLLEVLTWKPGDRGQVSHRL